MIRILILIRSSTNGSGSATLDGTGSNPKGQKASKLYLLGEKKKIYEEVRKVDKSTVIAEMGKEGWLEPFRTKAEKHWPLQIYPLYTIGIHKQLQIPPVVERDYVTN
jgi:hypothetical protein